MLMLARTAEIWSTPHETAWSLQALSEWMAVSGELENIQETGVGGRTGRAAAKRGEKEGCSPYSGTGKAR